MVETLKENAAMNLSIITHRDDACKYGQKAADQPHYSQTTTNKDNKK
jgi:hypothetical protein